MDRPRSPQASYLYSFLASSQWELSVDASLQLRNATLTFSSADGGQRWTSRDVGPVPALKVRGRYSFASGAWIGLEVDGLYVSGGLLNRDNTAESFNASILDASARAGMRVTQAVDVFLNLRCLGGGARGTDEEEAASGLGDGYSSNWLNTASVTLGFIYRLPTSPPPSSVARETIPATVRRSPRALKTPPPASEPRSAAPSAACSKAIPQPS